MKRLVTGILTLAILSGSSLVATPETNSIMPITTASAYTSWSSYGTWVIIAKSGLNMRSGPGTNYKKVGAIRYGDTAEGLRISSNGWAKVRYNGKVGWIYFNDAKYAYCVMD